MLFIFKGEKTMKENVSTCLSLTHSLTHLQLLMWGPSRVADTPALRYVLGTVMASVHLMSACLVRSACLLV